MSRRSTKLYIDDILDAIRKIEKYAKGRSFSKLVKDEKTTDAIVKNFIVLGEAIRNLPEEEIRKKYADIPWREIMDMRNKIVHEYFSVDEKIMWDAIKNNLPVFKKQIMKLKKDLKI